MLLVEEFDGAFIGVVHRKGKDPIAAYDYDGCIQHVIRTRQLTFEEALDWFETYVMSTNIGDSSPAFLELKTMGEMIKDYGH